MSIELRLSDVNPPAKEPPRTIYRDIVNLPNPVKLGLTIRYFNHDDVNLYFQITGSGAPYTFGTVNLGLLASGANAYLNLDQFASRAKPSAGDLTLGEMEEYITLTLKAYTDAGYSVLKWTFNRVVTVHWINSVDAAFTVDVLNNFDDGTVQGWAASYAGSGDISGSALGVTTGYVLSPPYSLYSVCNWHYVVTGGYYPYLNYFRILRGSTVLIHLGLPEVPDNANDYIPKDKWLRMVVPLPRNTALTLHAFLSSRRRMALYPYEYTSDIYKAFTTADKPTVFAIFDVRISYIKNTNDLYWLVWMDDFKIISK